MGWHEGREIFSCRSGTQKFLPVDNVSPLPSGGLGVDDIDVRVRARVLILNVAPALYILFVVFACEDVDLLLSVAILEGDFAERAHGVFRRAAGCCQNHIGKRGTVNFQDSLGGIWRNVPFCGFGVEENNGFTLFAGKTAVVFDKGEIFCVWFVEGLVDKGKLVKVPFVFLEIVLEEVGHAVKRP